MIELIEANGLAFLAVLLLGVLVAWWIWGHRPSERIRAETPDVLTPGAAPAERNTLLVEAPPATAAVVAPPVSIGMAGIGEVIAAGAAEEIGDAAAAAEAAPAPAIASAAGEPDDLSRIKGVGPKLNARLTELGITRYDQIAAWTAADVARVDAQLGPFAGRIERDQWVEQCRHLAAGDAAGFEAKFGKV